MMPSYATEQKIKLIKFYRSFDTATLKSPMISSIAIIKQTYSVSTLKSHLNHELRKLFSIVNQSFVFFKQTLITGRLLLTIL
jgi:hypothetical protein